MIVVLGALVAAAGAAIPALMLPQAAATVVATTKKARDAALAAEAAAVAKAAWIRKVTEEMNKPPLPEELKQVLQLLGEEDNTQLLQLLGRLPEASRPQWQEFEPGMPILATADEQSAYEKARAENRAALAGQLIRQLAARQEVRKQVFGV